ncbi:prevent-host-death protein [Streptomyces sp. CS227]|uniref:type II toxin-antitoxin system Phd/YefM family antitoxin n=1 Tax=Streptomyces sp. CS227 TaxID=1982763 RepID=UPI000B40BEC7|nr:type II toxin-antitoxin system Phd/YefM family antitoxin [Streptomyces sp. CS227]OWA14758.1 prevent-host-death protein [Streptomyces sp. CS227]
MPEHEERASGVTRDAVEAVENSVSVREARAHLAEHINRAESGTPTVVTRNGAPVAALVPFADFEVLEEAADLMLAREAEAVLARDEPTVTMAELVADLFSGRTPGPA